MSSTLNQKGPKMPVQKAMFFTGVILFIVALPFQSTDWGTIMGGGGMLLVLAAWMSAAWRWENYMTPEEREAAATAAADPKSKRMRTERSAGDRYLHDPISDAGEF